MDMENCVSPSTSTWASISAPQVAEGPTRVSLQPMELHPFPSIPSDRFVATPHAAKLPEVRSPLVRLTEASRLPPLQPLPAASPTSSSPSPDSTDSPNVLLDMRSEAERLASFRNWPVDFLAPERLAKNGFYYLGRNDEVRCAFCKVEIMRWEEGDDPAADHKRWAPQCPYLRRLAAEDGSPAAAPGTDECGPRPPPKAAPGRLPGPAHPQYATTAARMATFKDWPRSMRQKPEELADAGFFYTGQGDKTKCFYCDGGLKDWEDDDVPWEQHAIWFDRCAFLLLVKGRDYVQQVATEAATIAPRSDEPKPRRDAPPSPPAKAALFEVEAKMPPVEPPKGAAQGEEDNTLCRICYDNPRNVVFVPCGHVVACARCALTSNKCPMCRRTYTNAVRLYYS